MALRGFATRSGRFQHERPREAAHYDYMAAIADAIDIPVLASGGALDYVTREQLPQFKAAVSMCQ